MFEMNRRDFVAISALTIGAASTGCMHLDSPPTTGTVDIGSPGDFAQVGVNDRFAKSHKLLIVRTTDRLYVLSSVCTHRGCTLGVKENSILCPCHGSKFSNDGQRIAGPAVDPLIRYGVSLDSNNRLIVDRSRMFDENHGDDVGAFVTMHTPGQA